MPWREITVLKKHVLHVENRWFFVGGVWGFLVGWLVVFLVLGFFVHFFLFDLFF